MPVGLRFIPTDEELVDHYLRNKFLGIESPVEMISEIMLCNHEPWELPGLSMVQSEDPEWFFFSRLENMSPNSTRSRRATEAGYWKPTGRDRDIKLRGTNDVIGTKKTLVFYIGRAADSVKTNWVIHEYHAINFPPHERPFPFVVCRLMRRHENTEEEISNALVFPEGEPSDHMAPDYENEAWEDSIPDVASLPEVNLESIWLPADNHDSPSIQPSPLFTEQRTSVQNSPFPSITGNETAEEDADFVNSILARSEETQYAFVNDSTPSERH